MELDDVDVMIVNELMKDGCSSLRELARATGLSPPAVSSRIKRLKDAGLIKGTTVLIDRSKVRDRLSVIMLIKSDPSREASVSRELSSIEDVEAVYRLSGSYSIMVKAEVDGPNSLSSLTNRVYEIDGINEVNTLIISEFVAERQKPFRRLSLNLRCEYCGNPILGKPYELVYRNVTRFFCCPTCLNEFKKKYKIA